MRPPKSRHSDPRNSHIPSFSLVIPVALLVRCPAFEVDAVEVRGGGPVFGSPVRSQLPQPRLLTSVLVRAGTRGFVGPVGRRHDQKRSTGPGSVRPRQQKPRLKIRPYPMSGKAVAAGCASTRATGGGGGCGGPVWATSTASAILTTLLSSVSPYLRYQNSSHRWWRGCGRSCASGWAMRSSVGERSGCPRIWTGGLGVGLPRVSRRDSENVGEEDQEEHDGDQEGSSRDHEPDIEAVAVEVRMHPARHAQ